MFAKLYSSIWVLAMCGCSGWLVGSNLGGTSYYLPALTLVCVANGLGIICIRTNQR